MSDKDFESRINQGYEEAVMSICGGREMKQGVVSILIFPTNKDQTAVSMAIAHLLKEGWQFVGVQMTELHLQRTWEYDGEDVIGQIEVRSPTPPAGVSHMTLPDPAQRAREIAIKLTESCVHTPGPPKVDCPECCEAVLTDALTTFAAQQVAQAEKRTWEAVATLAASRHLSQAREGIDNKALLELSAECYRRAGGGG